MVWEPKPNQTNLFRNTRKEQENHADWQATVEIEGKTYYVNGWDKQGQKGAYISLSFKEKVTKLDNMRNDAARSGNGNLIGDRDSQLSGPGPSFDDDLTDMPF